MRPIIVNKLITYALEDAVAAGYASTPNDIVRSYICRTQLSNCIQKYGT